MVCLKVFFYRDAMINAMRLNVFFGNVFNVFIDVVDFIFFKVIFKYVIV